jgi:beta-lactam-binding protein with PASTA domain
MPTSGPVRPLPPATPISNVRDDGLVPDFTGMNGRDTVRILARLGLRPLAIGTGLVVAQQPSPGSEIQPGVKATIWLGSQLPHSSSGAGEP